MKISKRSWLLALVTAVLGAAALQTTTCIAIPIPIPVGGGNNNDCACNFFTCECD